MSTLKTILFALLLIGAPVAVAQTTMPAPDTIKRAFTWTDTRAIGVWHLSEPTQADEKNPAGWLDGPNWVDTYLARAMPVLKRINAQGVICWDIEGGRDGANMYLGSPDLAAKINPDIDYNGFFRRIRAEGFVPGVLIRPHEYDHQTKKFRQSVSPYDTMYRKIEFARTTWKCRLFYIDTNLEDINGGKLLPAIYFARLHKAFPDVLLIPEHEDATYHLWTAPYRELRWPMDETGTPAAVRACIPTAISAVFLSDGNVRGNAEALAKGRSIFLMNAWWMDPTVVDYIAALKN